MKLLILKRIENSSCSAMCVVHTVLHFQPPAILTTKMAGNDIHEINVHAETGLYASKLCLLVQIMPVLLVLQV